MTRQEAAAILKELPYLSLKANTDWAIERDINYQVAVNMAIKALEQQPCEDAISRQAVLEYIYNDLGLGDEENGKDVERQMELEKSYRYFKSLPPVTPKIETGHWIYLKNNKARCSKCHDVVLIAQMYGNANYCPNCGKKMIDVPDINDGELSEITTGSESEE